MKHLQTITSVSAEKPRYIAEASDIFYYIDSDFKNWGTDKDDNTPWHTTVEVKEITKDGTFAQIFTDPEKMCLSQGQILEFCRNHKKELRQDGYATFFLFKALDEYFVAYVYVYSGGLGVYVRRFSYDPVFWRAQCRRRIVIPQLKSIPLETVALSSSDSLTLEKAIRICKENGLTVTKVY